MRNISLMQHSLWFSELSHALLTDGEEFHEGEQFGESSATDFPFEDL
jgi:hypothetical protein